MFSWLTRAGRWVYAIGLWLTAPKIFWLAFTVTLIAIVITLWPGVTEFQIRATGMVLQWLGIATVAVGIRQTRKLFGQPGLFALFLAWLVEFPRWRRDVVIQLGTGKFETRGGKARVWSWGVIDRRAPIEEQVRVLTNNLENLNNDVRELQGEMDREFGKRDRSLSNEEQARAKADADLHKRLEAAQTGGLQISFVGVVWLFLGVCLGTISQEIFRWLH